VTEKKRRKKKAENRGPNLKTEGRTQKFLSSECASKRVLKSGAVLLELILALAIGLTILTTIGAVFTVNREANMVSAHRQEAELMLQEAGEAIKSISSNDWSKVATPGAYYPQVEGGNWVLKEGEEDRGLYERGLVIDEVYRDSEGNIATSGGTIDPASKKITSSINWKEPPAFSISETFYLFRWRENETWIEDTGEDFQDGVEDATDVFINPGYIQLAQTGGGGEWTEPTVIKHVDAFSKGNGIWAQENYLYFALGPGDNRIQVFDITTDPETPTSLNAFATINEVNNIAISNGYLYAALNNAEMGLEIFDVGQDPVDPPSLGTADLGVTPSGLWIEGGYLFASLQKESKVNVYSLQDPLSPSFEGSFNTRHHTTDITGSGNYIYVSQDSNPEGMQVFDISESAVNPISVGTIPVFYKPSGIWLESNTIYLSLSGKRAAMYTLTQDPTNPTLMGIFRTEQNSSDITALGDYGYIGGMDSYSRAIGIIYVGESKGISGIYFVYGEYISSVLEIEKGTTFNRLEWESSVPAGTDVLFQIAVADSEGELSFVGPDGTQSSFYEEPGSFPLEECIGKYVRYKAILTGNSSVTPTVDRVIINYSH